MSKILGRRLREPQLARDWSRDGLHDAGSSEGVADAARLLVELNSERLRNGASPRTPATLSSYPQAPDDRWTTFLGEIASDLKLNKRSKRAA